MSIVAFAEKQGNARSPGGWLTSAQRNGGVFTTERVLAQPIGSL